MSISLLELIESGGYKPTTDPQDAIWLLSKQSEFAELVEQAEDFIEERDNAEYQAELEQERADEIRQAMREDGLPDPYDSQPEGDFSGASYDPEWGGR